MKVIVTVIPAYNAAPYLCATLDSLAAQELRPDRVIVLDDCSTDETPSIAQNFRGLPVQHVRNPKNLGLFENHNRALEFATEADFLHILHANDLIKPKFYASLVSLLDGSAKIGMAFSRYDVIDDAGAFVRSAEVPGEPSTRTYSRKQMLVLQSELKSLLIDAVLLKCSRQPVPCRFRLDLPHLGDVMFHSEWASASDMIASVSRALCRFREHNTGATRRNVTQLNAWVLDEWRVMQAVARMIPEPQPMRILRRFKLRCLFAARSHVKIQQTRDGSPQFAEQICAESLARVGRTAWLIGGAAVRVRDAFLRRRQPINP